MYLFYSQFVLMPCQRLWYRILSDLEWFKSALDTSYGCGNALYPPKVSHHEQLIKAILGLMPWEILSVEQAMHLIAYGDQWYSEPLGAFTTGPPYIQDWNEDVEITYSNELINGETINVSSNCLPVKATRFEPDGHCFHDVALKLVGCFMEEKVEDDDEINDSLPKDKEPDYMQSAFSVVFMDEGVVKGKFIINRVALSSAIKVWI
ncbi:DnaJ homolog subfamily C member 2-like protein, partial [Tanacetum coccineum]